MSEGEAVGHVTRDMEKLKSNGATDLGSVQYVFPDEEGWEDVVEVFEDICVCVRAQERTTNAGLVLPNEDEARQRVAKAIAVGPGRTLDNGTVIPNPVKAGDVVLFGAYASAGEPLRHNGKDYLLFKSRDLVLKFKR